MDLIGSICNVLAVQEAVERSRRSLPPRAACITFDDGYANNRTVAAPILQARGLPATVFVATRFHRQRPHVERHGHRSRASRRSASSTSRDLGLGGIRADATCAARHQAIETLLGALKYRRTCGAHGARTSRSLSASASRCRAADDDGAADPRAATRFGCDVGAHTVMHPILRSVDPSEAAREIAQSKATLEAITGVP